MYPKLHAHEVSPPEAGHSGSTQPYGNSNFLPGKLDRKTATFLLDTGSITDLMSRRLFDTLNAQDRANLELYKRERGVHSVLWHN